MLNQRLAKPILKMGTPVTSPGSLTPAHNRNKRRQLAHSEHGLPLAAPTRYEHAGFSITELMVAVAILLIISAIVIPTAASMLRDYRAMGDIRGIAAQATLARMRAASNFTTARLNFDPTANTYQLEIWDKTANGGLGVYRAEGAVQSLSPGTSFGYGTLTVPVGGQTTVAQPSPPQMTFNSRGYSVNNGGTPTGTAVIYVSDTRKVWAVSVSLAGQITAWVHSGSTWRSL